ncbi:uncharacterized protein N7515_007129 [Penicillium bovifimosum]|uniref:Uncharacterized protein n=1 Tax=Penicillium bovifimosum TaxID=126998 RepID=A0A9W9L1T5_9EURO|nr:uncharacterized protein N7515_007129 [Penicillium bovifimosum]KAJ5131090.1 hypothetical protein N7515_007129 [Penicillium bovifimosum]
MSGVDQKELTQREGVTWFGSLRHQVCSPQARKARLSLLSQVKVKCIISEALLREPAPKLRPSRKLDGADFTGFCMESADSKVSVSEEEVMLPPEGQKRHALVELWLNLRRTMQERSIRELPNLHPFDMQSFT